MIPVYDRGQTVESVTYDEAIAMISAGDARRCGRRRGSVRAIMLIRPAEYVPRELLRFRPGQRTSSVDELRVWRHHNRQCNQWLRAA